jgi:hypothetical protein
MDVVMRVQNEFHIVILANWELTQQDINLNCIRLQTSNRKTTISREFHHIDVS